eukprot:COSAG06_NODE_3425_length_5365_cov_4.474744_3_plen_64_part_00
MLLSSSDRLGVCAGDASLGWSNVGYHNPHAQTPHLDRLVRAGIELDRECDHQQSAPFLSLLQV